jgi:hypothetical protein
VPPPQAPPLGGGGASAAREHGDGPASRAGKNRGETRVVAAAENRGRGRPLRLTPELGELIAAELAAGADLGKAARAAGISPRTLRSWRQRAWSSRPEDRRYVELEQRLRPLLGPGDAASSGRHGAEPWEAVAARIEANERWWGELDGG